MNHNGHIHEAVRVATGEITKAEFAKSLNVDPATVSRNLAKYYQGAIKSLQDERKRMQADASKAQDAAIVMQDEIKALQDQVKALQDERNELQSYANRWQAQPKIVQALASVHASTAMLFLLAAFEGVGSFHLLQYKGVALALPVSIAIAFALLHFTAKQNSLGKWFCILFALAVGGIYFDVIPRSAAAWLFAFVPPIIAALIAFSFTLKTSDNG